MAAFVNIHFQALTFHLCLNINLYYRLNIQLEAIISEDFVVWVTRTKMYTVKFLKTKQVQTETCLVFTNFKTLTKKMLFF